MLVVWVLLLGWLPTAIAAIVAACQRRRRLMIWLRTIALIWSAISLVLFYILLQNAVTS